MSSSRWEAPALAARQATSTIPIVFAMAGDPVGKAWSQSWRGRAATSLACRIQTADLAGKRIELLREVLPGLRRLAIIGNIGSPLE